MAYRQSGGTYGGIFNYRQLTYRQVIYALEWHLHQEEYQAQRQALG